MKISVISPLPKQGTTIVSMLLGLLIAKTQKLKVCWTHTGIDTDSFYAYSGLQDVEDITMSIGQVVRLLEANAITGDQIGDYCQNIENCMDIINTAAVGLTQEDSGKVLRFVLENIPHDIIITDIDTDMNALETKEILMTSDLIICLVSQNKEFEMKFDKWAETDLFNDISTKKIIYIVNKYDSYVESLRETTKGLRLIKNNCSKISYNPFVIKFSNEARLGGLTKYILDRDMRVISLYADFRDTIKLIMSNLGYKFEWRD